MQIEITQATLAEMPILSNLLELYQYEFTDYTHEDIRGDGRYGMEHLDLYWSEEGRWPFIVRVDGKLAGFALARRATALDGSDCFDMAEFFVMRKYRRHGVGEAMARHVLDRFRGRWQVREMADNTPAHAFWRAIIGRCTDGDYTERVYDDERWRGPVQSFDSSAK